MEPAGATAENIDAVSVLTSDHRRVEGLWNEAVDAQDKTALIDTIVRELSIHDGIEKQLLYPTLSDRVEGGPAVADRGLADHQKVEELLARLQACDPGSDEAFRVLRETMDNVREHVADEEGRLFPALKAALSPEELTQLGADLEAARAVAPTRPHPASPNKGASAMVAGAVSGVMDHARDALSGRPATENRPDS